jgi:CubicO group peptidase (beta-lactamase class C family)
MTITSIGSSLGGRSSPWGNPFPPILIVGVLSVVLSSLCLRPASAANPVELDTGIEERIQGLIPSLEDRIASGMKGFDIPGLAIGIVADDRLVYARGFGVRSKGGQPVDTRTIFQIGSATKAFLATTIAIAVDHGKLRWDDRVVDLDPDFQLKDPWVTREFRVFDLIAQRSGMPPYANDILGMLGFDEDAMVRSLRYVEPVSSFRSTFAYTNITHIIAGRVVAKAEGEADWNGVLRKELLDPLGMTASSYTAEAIKVATNHAEGYRYEPNGSVEVPFDQLFPYDFGGAGDINSNVEDLARWVRLQLANGAFEGRRLISPENLAVTRTPKVAINDRSAYALGWVITHTPGGNIIWHNGGTYGFGAYIGLELDKDFAVIVLSNQSNVGFPDALGAWAFDRLLDNPPIDYLANTLKNVKAKFADNDKMFARPANPRPSPALASLAGNFSNPSFGKALLRLDAGALVLKLEESGAQLKLEPWDGDIFTTRLVPNGRFAQVAANLGPRPSGFVQFQMDKDGKLNLLRLSLEDGQAYEFRRQMSAPGTTNK